MSEKEEEKFRSSKTCWICEKLIDDDHEKVRDHCHVTGKFKGAGHWGCNINLQLTKKFPVIFHNLIGYDSRLINDELKNCGVKIDVLRLEKYIAILFIDSMQFINSSLETQVKNLSDNDFKYLTEEFGSKNLELLKQKDA